MASGERNNETNNGGINNPGPDLDTIIGNAIARFFRENQLPQGPPGPPGPPGNPGPPGEPSNGPHTPRFNPGDVGFFDPFYNNKSADTGPGMEHTGKETFFRDVVVFIDRIKDVSHTKGTELVRLNLQLCLRGEALEWYTSQLTDAEKRLLTYGQDLDEWVTFLMERFGPPKSIGMAQLLKERYMINNATRHREPREYAMAIVRAAKVAKLKTVHNQLDIIWNGLDVEFQSDIDPPDTNTTLNQFLRAMDRRKHQWWQKASRMRPSSGTAAPSRSLPQTQAQRSNNTGQYNNSRGPSRSFGSGNQNYGSRQQPQFPYRQNNNAYNPQFQRYQNQYYGNPAQGQGQGYQSYQSYQTYQPRPQEQQQQAQLPAPPQPRQITAGPTLQPNANTFGSRQFGNNMSSNNYRNNSYPPQQPQRAYHATVAEDTDDHSWHDENQDCYHGSEGFDVGPLPEGDQQAFHTEVPDPQEHISHEEIDINFITTPAEIRYHCKRCQATFISRNALFSHL